MKNKEWDEEATIVGEKGVLKAVMDLKRQRAYVIVIAGPNVGKMFPLEGGAHDIGRGGDASIVLTDTEISRRHAIFHVQGNEVRVEDLNSTNGTFVNGDQVNEQTLRDGDKIQVGTTTILKFTYHDQLDAQFQQKMLEAALHDGLTGAYNKKFFLERLESEMAFAQRHSSPLALVMFDLDHFKTLNDTYGHLAGDYVLKTLAGGIQESVRREDVFARYGGEEFVVLSRGIDLEAGHRFAERLRHWVEIYPFTYEGKRLPVTTSLGVASFPETKADSGVDLIRLADRALYKAKDGGRNRVVVAD
ncbi:MAG: GGDEF domain-containing protein [Myxococcota bacterium]